MALTKSKKHFIGLTRDDGGKKGGLAFQADKSDYRGILTGLEGVSGKEDSEHGRNGCQELSRARVLNPSWRALWHGVS